VRLGLEKAHHRLTQREVVLSGEDLLAAAGPRERHLEDLADRRRRPPRHHDDPAGEEQRLVDVVGHHEDGPALRLPERQQLLLEVHAGERVEQRERLVEEQQLRLERERAGDADPLLHAGGELARREPAEPGQPDRREVGLR
jgi:hypothetical protein